MKKVLSYVLVIALVLGSFSMAFAADDTNSTNSTNKTNSTNSTNSTDSTNSTKAAKTGKLPDIKGLDCEDAVNVLINLKVIDGYPDGTYKPAEIVQRDQAAKLIITALGLDATASGVYSTKFTDVGSDHWAGGYINYAASLGIINGYPDGTFKPSNTVTYNEFVTMAVRALGYRDISLTGVWPGNYVDKGRGLGILDDIKAAGNAGANRGDVATMLYQALDQYIGTLDKDGVFQATEVNPNRKKDEDAVYDTMLRRLGATYNPIRVILGNEDALINIKNYTGAIASYYTDKDDYILSVDEVKTTFLTGSFNVAKRKFEVGNVEYNYANASLATDNTSDKNDIAAKVFANGEPNGGEFKDATSSNDYFSQLIKTTVKADFATLLETPGSIKHDVAKDISTGDFDVTIGVDVSGKTIKQIHSISTWEISKDDLFASGDATDIKNDQELFGYDFPLTDDEDIDMQGFELIGVDSLEDISVDDVIYVYEGPDSKEITRVAVGTETAEGTINLIDTDSTDTYVTGVKLDTTYYNVSSPNPTVSGSDKLAISDTGVAMLDGYGDIYKWKIGDGSSGNYALVTGVDDFASSGTGSGKLKMYTKDGKENVYNVSKKLNFYEADGTKTSNNAAQTSFNTAFASFNANNPVVIEFGLNTSGEITKVQMLDEQDFTVKAYTNKTGKALYYDQTAGNESKSITVESNVTVFAAKGSSSNEYYVKGLDSIKDTTFKNAGTFYKKDNKVVAMITKNSDTGSGDEKYALVYNVRDASKDGDTVQMVDYYESGKLYKDVYTNDSGYFSKLIGTQQTEMLYEILVDSDGVITSAEQVTGLKTGQVDTPMSNDKEVLDVDGVRLYLDNQVKYYKWDESKGKNGGWTTAKRGDMDAGTSTVYLYNSDEDNTGGYDIVIIKNW